MTAWDYFKLIGGLAGIAALGLHLAAALKSGLARHRLRCRNKAFVQDYERAKSFEKIVDRALNEGLDNADGYQDFERQLIVEAAKIDLEDLVLLSRFKWLAGYKLAACRMPEILEWQARRRKQPLQRLVAFFRSAEVG